MLSRLAVEKSISTLSTKNLELVSQQSHHSKQLRLQAHKLLRIAFNVGCDADTEAEIPLLVGRWALGQVDGVQLFFHDVDEAQAVAIFLPERTLRRRKRAVSIMDASMIARSRMIVAC